VATCEDVYKWLKKKPGKARVVPIEWERMCLRLVTDDRARMVGTRYVCCGPRNSVRRLHQTAVAL
jgi:hypothetical protein